MLGVSSTALLREKNLRVCVYVCAAVYKLHVRNAAYMDKRLGLVQLERLCRLGYGLLNWGVSAVCHRPVSHCKKI